MCARALEVAIPLCSELGLPVTPEKVDSPSTVLTFVGIEIDSQQQILRLPPTKLAQLQETVEEWRGRRAATKQQLQSLIGLYSVMPRLW